ncbi:MAG: hypothetical protein QM571_05145 [Micrococcaceae bacterium]
MYVGDTKKIDNSAKMLAKYNIGKGCIRLTKTKNIEDGLSDFIKATIATSREGKDIDC